MKTNIPKLGETAKQVLDSALRYDTAGYLLKFNVACEGEWQYSRAHNVFEKCGKVRGLPIIERVEPASFEAWLLEQISKGYVTIYTGDSRNHWELHRATARAIPMGLDLMTA